MLRCPDCDHAADLPLLLDNAKHCSAMKRWVSVDCPACGGRALLEFGPRTVAIGDIDGAPGPCFMEHQRMPLGAASVRWDTKGVRIRIGGRSWTLRG